jgi:oxygen-independent coproporphyrinogen-3 oxidase
LFINTPYSEAVSDLYVEAVKRELSLYSTYLEEPLIKHIYFSGGTPSLISHRLSDILSYIHELFEFNGNVAIEANPLDLDDKTLGRLMNAGVTQISIGVQSFNDSVLKGIGRGYDSKRAVNAVKKAIDYGFEHVNIDLMFPLPGQTIDSLVRDLELAVSLNVHSVSTYPLMLLPYTEMYRRLRDNASKMESTEEKMYMTIVDYMTSVGYDVSSIWRFSLKPSSYNGPFEYDEFLGVGPYAWGLVDDLFTVNTPLVEDYLVAVKRGIPVSASAKFRDEGSMIVKFARSLYRGKVDKGDLYEKLGVGAEEKLRPLIYILRWAGLIECEGNLLRLTKRGMLYGSLTTKKIVTGLLMKMHKATGYYPPL